MPSTTELKKTKVVLVDDHPLVREQLAGLLQAEPDLAVCGQAADVANARSLISQEEPDLVLLDVSLKDSNGLELLQEWQASRPLMRVLVLSMHDEARFAQRALAAGARGYITKEDASVNLMTAIRKVLGGDTYLSARIASRLRKKQNTQAPSGSAEA